MPKDFTAIYELRRDRDTKRQTSHEINLSQLHTTLFDLLKKSHPYSLYDNDFKRLEATSAYHATCKGLPAQLSGEYCYHVTSLGKLKKFSPDLQPRELDLDTMSESKTFDYIMEQYRDAGDWLPMRRFLGGWQSGPRKLSWWTDLELPGPNLLCEGHRMGLANGAIARQAIVLRCPTKYIVGNALAFVPSILDAFFSGIFHATVEADSPECGMTIDLEGCCRRLPNGTHESDNLKPGVAEYVLPPLNIDAAGLELQPVAEADKSSHNVHIDQIQDILWAYYNGL